jgi:hypothetical protein
VIRFFCRPTELALSCLEVFHNEAILVRVLPIGAVHFGTATQWAKYNHMFMTPITDDYVNVVCGDGDDFEKHRTDGVINIAVTPDEMPDGYDGCAFSPDELLETLKEYDW